MGEHSKPESKISALITWALTHKRVVLSFVVGALSAVTAVKPDFPADAVLRVAHAVLGV